MDVLATLFKSVSLIFAFSAVGTGLQALLDPLGFSKGFGIPYSPDKKDAKDVTATANNNLLPYISLVGARQLATGMTLLLFSWRSKWTEMAELLSILGFVVAGSDGLHLFRIGNTNQAIFHALPGSMIALLSATYALRRGQN